MPFEWTRLLCSCNRRWALDSLAELAFGAVVGLLIAVIVQLAIFGQPITSDFWLTFFLIFSASAWIASVFLTRNKVADQTLADEYNRLVEQYSHVPGLMRACFLFVVRALETELADLQARGKPWSADERLKLARSVISESRIKTYDATSLDPPYSAHRTFIRFLEDQRSHLRGAKLRRLLIFPKTELLKAMESERHRRRLIEFIALHDQLGRRTRLRYLPCTPMQIRQIVVDELGFEDDPVLLDFGIINGAFVWGQAVEAGNVAADVNVGDQEGQVETELAPLQGAVAIRVDDKATKYCDLFEKLWSFNHDRVRPATPQTPEPQAQLELYIKIAEMRRRMRASCGHDKETVPNWDGALFDRVARAGTLHAIDTCPRRWIYDEDYKTLLRATIESCKAAKDESFERIFVVREPMTDADKDTFCNTIVRPLVDAGYRIYFVASAALLDQNAAVLDCIIGDNWGIYLSPWLDDADRVRGEYLSTNEPWRPAIYEVEDDTTCRWIRDTVVENLKRLAAIAIMTRDEYGGKRVAIRDFLSNPFPT